MFDFNNIGDRNESDDEIVDSITPVVAEAPNHESHHDIVDSITSMGAAACVNDDGSLSGK